MQLAAGRLVGSLSVLTAQDEDATAAMLASWVSQIYKPRLQARALRLFTLHPMDPCNSSCGHPPSNRSCWPGSTCSPIKLQIGSDNELYDKRQIAQHVLQGLQTRRMPLKDVKRRIDK
eukprot:scaffold129718_cov17-Tisochrysis_lutea.AAC.1